MDNTRASMPLEMADTPDQVVDFFIRVARLKIETLEGEIIYRKKQINDMKIVLRNDPDNKTLINSIGALNEIYRERLYAKKNFKTAMIKLQQQGKRLFGVEKSSTEPEGTVIKHEQAE